MRSRQEKAGVDRRRLFYEGQSRPVSRILCIPGALRHRERGSHSSRRAIADALKLPTRRRDGGPVLHLEDARLPTWNCSGWRLPCRSALQQPRCALTAPFHPYLIPACAGPSAVCFLLPCSACRHGWPLAITLPCGVRTFLAPPGIRRESRDCLACFAGRKFTIVAALLRFIRRKHAKTDTQASRQPIVSPARSGTTEASPATISAGSVQSSRVSVTRSLLRGRP